MKKNRGFTLVELLAVIIILGGIALIVFPTVLNSIKNSEMQIDEKTTQMIITAAELYVDSNLNDYPLVNGNIYCLPIESLTQSKYLEKGIIEATKVDLSDKIVKITALDKYAYEIVNKNECIEIK